MTTPDRRTPPVLLALAVAAPAAVAGACALARHVLANTGAALVLVLVVVAVAACGDRVAGLVAALSAAVAFDFFLTAPYLDLAIVGRDDLETAGLLLAIGVAVSEIAVRGRRHAQRAARRSAYLDGIAHAAELAAGARSADLVADMIAELLDLDDCRFEPAGVASPAPEGRPVVERDGTVRWAGRAVPVTREGLPATDVVELPAGHRGEAGRFLLTASSELRRPEPEQLRVAVVLAEQVSSAGHPAV